VWKLNNKKMLHQRYIPDLILKPLFMRLAEAYGYPVEIKRMQIISYHH